MLRRASKELPENKIGERRKRSQQSFGGAVFGLLPDQSEAHILIFIFSDGCFVAAAAILAAE